MTMLIRALRRTILLYLPIAISSGIPAGAKAQIVGEAERNVSEEEEYQNECAIAVNPTNKNQLFAACNNAQGGIFFARSTDRGTNWVYPDPDKTLADGDAGQGPVACCDPTLAWDSFGNLFVTYLGSVGSVETLLSTDGGQTFTNLATFAGSVDQPTIVAETTTDPASPVAVWVVWNQSNQMRARGAAVTGLGAVGAFGPLQTIQGTVNCSFGDVAVSPAGVVVQVCQTPTGGQGPGNLLVSIDPDGVGPAGFGAPITATTTNVGGFDFIPAQSVRSVDSEAGLAFDRNPNGGHAGRLYLVYTEEPVNESDDTDVIVRFSDDDGANWSAPVQVNDDTGSGRSQFLPKIASNPLSGNIAVCWHDARNSAANDEMQEFCSLATPTGAAPAFFSNVQVSAGQSQGSGSNPPAAGQLDIQYGDYSGLAYFQGRFHPIWADQSNSTGDNPDLMRRWEAYSNRISGGPAANEGDPHIRTVDNVHYDFQASGEFVALKGADGFELQTRQTAVSTTFFPGPNPHTGLATCVSVNSAVAARIGEHRVTYEPAFEGAEEGREPELRVDGVPTALTDAGVALAHGGRVIRTSAGGARIEAADGAVITATPMFWQSQGVWYMNVDTNGSEAFEGVMGAIPAGSWLPALPDGGSLGPIPADLGERFQILYDKFANSWRVTKDTSLFDYPPGLSTTDFTLPDWPKSKPPCDVPNTTPANPAEVEVAEQACREVMDKERRENCVFDVTVTGETGFAKLYLQTENLEQFATSTLLALDTEAGAGGKPFAFTVTVLPDALNAHKPPEGMVQFFLHDDRVGEPLKLDETGRATWKPDNFDWQNFRVAAEYQPAEGTAYLPSRSLDIGIPDRSNVDVPQTK